MDQKDRIKVCIMVSSLGVGGAERSSAILSRILEDVGYEVTIVSVLDDIVYNYKGELINLGKLTSGQIGWKKKLLKFYYAKKVFTERGFDYIIDGRSRPNWFQQKLTNFLLFKKVPTIFMIHSYDFNLSFPRYKFLAKNLYKHAYKLVAVSEAILDNFQKVYNFTNGECIYNAYDPFYWDQLSNEKKTEIPTGNYILAYGRIEDGIKNYSFLIKAFAKSRLPKKGIKLLIMGDGPDKTKIQSLVKSCDLEGSVIFKGFSKNPFPYVKKALFTTLTSNYEGFPMVLIESLAMGTPVISVDCKSGPSEIIVNGKNGILVPFKDELSYIEALNKMVENQEFYNQCKAGTMSSVSIFKIENITPKWLEILPLKR